jgi:hypothetical protein
MLIILLHNFPRKPVLQEQIVLSFVFTAASQDFMAVSLSPQLCKLSPENRIKGEKGRKVEGRELYP